MEKLLRIKDVIYQSGLCKSAIYNHIAIGIFPTPIKIGERSIRWPSSEIEAINKARIAGKTDQEIGKLVETLMEKRKAS